LRQNPLFSKDVISGIELYYTEPKNLAGDRIVLEGDDFNHAIKVMRHTIGDQLYITDGAGNMYSSVMEYIEKGRLIAAINDTKKFENKSANIYFCFPRLKNPDRFEFALEKCVELGITNFLIFDAARGVAKGGKAERWSKILLAAMKQSLRTHTPMLEFCGALKTIANIEGSKIVLEQEAEKEINEEIIQHNAQKYYFVFGPEGGLTSEEAALFNSESFYALNPARLRSETAIMTAAAYIKNRLK
jgi:16S rRNA (uracil1498-N3)-methyltransferase